MNTFQPSPALRAFYDVLVAQANAQGAFTAPPPAIPARPADVQQAAFLDHLCMPLYGLLKNAYDRATAVIAQAQASPFGVDPYTGQPYNPDAWGTQSGAP